MKEKDLFKISLVVITIFMLIQLSISYMKDVQLTFLDKLIPITKINTDKKVVAFACNVYEGNEEIEKMLEVMKKKGVKISFFLGGIWVKNNTECTKKIMAYGHEIQNHGYMHKKSSVLSRQSNMDEITKTENIIFEVTGKRTNLFEPPYGDYDDRTIEIANKLGYRVVTWSIDTIDWREDATKELILERIRKKLHPGGIILIHPKKITSESIENIIDYIHNEGYEIITVGEILKEQ
ncbi:hypothetical protein Q428_09150 [Fervidicella metallireducens AeB]|uniref:NodB homology domain-containing protein n=1 Tax=Fervidicella metallireducens AeB TaxID=1403537 RepID=A0A017RU37_9CLOT|nr:polysaccharide deacetylase family protein [Fervidicella metallireducens]EYE88187.1 hypothetical protein Q428_09150 [Fervidicella metallireducens AeB]